MAAKRAEWIVAALVVAGVFVLAVVGTWPFDSSPRPIARFEEPSIWQYLLSDRRVLGVVRLAIVAASLFLLASIAALAVARRWISGLGGLSVDEKESAEERISDLEDRLNLTQDELDKEVVKRREAEDWADALVDELDQANIQLEAQEAEQDGDGNTARGDSGPA